MIFFNIKIFPEAIFFNLITIILKINFLWNVNRYCIEYLHRRSNFPSMAIL